MNHIPLLWRYVIHITDTESSITGSELINLVGHYNQIVDKSKDVSPEVASRGYSEAALAQMNQKFASAFTPFKSCGILFTRPPSGLKSDLLSYGLILFDNYERGVLPFPGSVSEQPAKVMDLFGVLQSLRVEREEALSRKLKSNVRNQHQGSARTNR